MELIRQYMKIPKPEPINLEKPTPAEPPPKPIPHIGWRYEDQAPHEDEFEYRVRKKADRANFYFLFSAMLLLATNISAGIIRLIGDTNLGFPIGFIPLPLVLWTYFVATQKKKDLANAITGRSLRRQQTALGQALENANAESRGTTTVRR